MNDCWLCGGRGDVACPWCAGSGVQEATYDGAPVSVMCWRCGGTGRAPCLACFLDCLESVVFSGRYNNGDYHSGGENVTKAV